jgi:hypothetical protein
MFARIILSITFVLFLSIAVSCSGGDALTSPEAVKSEVSASGESHVLWGLYQFTADQAAGTLDVTTLRTGSIHLNVLPFLEPPPLVHLSLESLEFNGDIVDVEIGLRHPFIGLTEFTGFDVCGILISNGSYSGYTDSNIVHAGPGDTYLMNPDGHARWWNPNEFPTGGIGGYNDGLLGTPDSVADFNSTLNGYKYFSDGLDYPEIPVINNPIEVRGMFSSGQKNTRLYIIQLGGEGLTFNYAVDASWQYPDGDPPYQAPDDFAIEANRVEPWCIDVHENSNTLYYYNSSGGGSLDVTIDVYDWADAANNVLYIESPGGVIPEAGPFMPVSGGEGFSTYEVEIIDAFPGAAGYLPLLVTVETLQEDFQGYITGVNTSAYFVYPLEVSAEPVHTVTGIIPAYGKPDKSLTGVEVYGTDFTGGTSLAVSLAMDGQSDINATNVAYVDSGTLSCDISIPAGAALGLWDVEVTNGGGGISSGQELFEIFDCGPNSPPISSGYIITSPPGTMFGEWCGVTCTRQGTSYVIATGPIHNYLAAIVATATSGSSQYTAYAGGYLEHDLACTSDNTIYFATLTNNSMLRQISFDPATGFGTATDFASLPFNWWVQRICVDDEDNPVVLGWDYYNYQSVKIFHWNGTGWDETVVPPVVIGPGSKYIRDFDYNPVLDQYACISIQSSTWYMNLYALDRDGNVVHTEADIYSWNHLQDWWGGIYINQDEPECRVIVWGGSTYSGSANVPRPVARYDAYYENKSTSDIPGTFFGAGESRGAWAPGTNRFYTTAMGGNVFQWFILPNDW